MRRTLIIIAVVITSLVVLGFLVHTFDLIGLLRSMHGGGPASH